MMSSPETVFGSLSKPLISGQFEWNINVCSDEIFETNRYLDSPTFSFSHCSWFVRLFPKGVHSSNSDWISLFLIKKSISQSDISMSYALDMTIQGFHVAHLGGNYTFKKKIVDGLAFDKFLLRDRISCYFFPLLNGSNLLSIKIGLMHDVPCKEDTVLAAKIQGDEILHQNYKDLLVNDENHDLVLKVKDKEFKAHQIIMQFRCPVFKAMLSHDMLEKKSGVIEIPDCDPSAFEQFLFYIYTGNLEILDESVMLGLYYIADKYDMPSLKEMCCEFIKKSLATTNVCDVISLALNHSDSPLLECGEKYFVDNAREVLVSTEWQSFIIENPIHANTLFVKAYDNGLPKDRSAPSRGNNVVNMPANTENNVPNMPASRENNIAYRPANRENNIVYGPANGGNNIAYGPAIRGNNIAYGPAIRGNNIAYGPAPANRENNIAYGPANRENNMAYGPANRENNMAYGPANRENNMAYEPANRENNMAYGPANRENNMAYAPANGENNIAYGPANRENAEREYIMIE